MRRRELIRVIREPEHIEPACDWLREMVTKGLPGGPVQVSIGRERRNLDQNALLHALLTQIARQCEFAGKKRTVDEWKLIFVSGHAASEGRPTEACPGIEGEFINLRESTARMSKKRINSLIEYILAWCADNDVEIRMPSKEDKWNE